MKKKVGKKNGHELYEVRTHAIKSKIGHRDHLTILPKIHVRIFRETRDRQHTHTCTAQHKREAVVTDDGSQPPIEQLATAVHRGSATRSWCGPLLLVCAARRGCNVFGVLCMLSDV